MHGQNREISRLDILPICVSCCIVVYVNSFVLPPSAYKSTSWLSHVLFVRLCLRLVKKYAVKKQKKVVKKL